MEEQEGKPGNKEIHYFAATEKALGLLLFSWKTPPSSPLRRQEGAFEEHKVISPLVVRAAAGIAAMAAVMSMVVAMKSAAHDRMVPVVAAMVHGVRSGHTHLDVGAKRCGAEDKKPQSQCGDELLHNLASRADPEKPAGLSFAIHPWN
jgi:hypothetical protein